MGCFRSCFGSNWKRNKTMRRSLLLQDQCLSPSHEIHEEAARLVGAANQSQEHEETDGSIKLISESKHESEEEQQLNSSSKRKEVLFTYSNFKKLHMDNMVENDEISSTEKRTEEKREEKGLDPGLIPRPKSDRHQDLSTDHKKGVVISLKSREKGSLNDNVSGGDCCGCVLVQPESSESLFSLDIDSLTRKPSLASPPATELGDKEVSSSFKPPANKVVLSQQKVEAKDVPKVYEQGEKENEESHQLSVEVKSRRGVIGGECDQFSFKTVEKHEPVGVDTSLSSWLAGSGNSNCSSGDSEKNYRKDSHRRRILGAITFTPYHQEQRRQLNQSNASDSDDALLVGTVGSYLLHTAR